MRAAALLAGLLLAAACRPGTPEVPGPLRPAPRAAESRPGDSWPVPPEEAERLFATSPLELVTYEAMAEGVAGAFKSEVRFLDGGRRMKVKWKTAPAGDFDGWNNNPRKELASYAVQQWFLDPKDYVVPTVALRCVPVAAFERFAPGTKPSLPGTNCVIGTLFLWLQNVEVPAKLYDPEQFVRDPWYAYHLANFNLFAFLVEHRDARAGNVLVSTGDGPRRVFAVDNGISFGELIYNFLVANWDVMRVPALRREAIERLRAVDGRRLDALGTLVELAVDRAGGMRPVEGGPPIDPTRGVRVTRDRVQMGLTRAEIGAVATRLAELLRRVDDGSLPVF